MLADIRVVSLKGVDSKSFGPGFVYVGRRIPGRYAASPLGNPFRRPKDGKPGDTLPYYKRWLWKQYQHNGAVHNEIERIVMLARKHPVVLGCWCTPNPCHAEVIKDLIMWRLKIIQSKGD